MLLQLDLFLPEDLPFLELRQQGVVRLPFRIRFRCLFVEFSIPVKPEYRPGRTKQVVSRLDVDPGLVEFRRLHLTRHETFPDQLIQLVLFRCEKGLDLRGLPIDGSGPDRFVGVLDPLLLRLVHTRGCGEIRRAYLILNIGSSLLDRLL